MTNEPLLVSITEKPFYVYTNPSFSELLEIGPLLRFTANNKNKIIYVWDYYHGFHAQVSVGLKFLETFNSTDFLRGHAGKNDNEIYQMVGSDFLNSFVGKMTNKDKVFLNNLLNQNWDWVDNYIKITGWMNSYRERLGI
jgi:hypothetical protein